jgi:hypothetical protein
LNFRKIVILFVVYFISSNLIGQSNFDKGFLPKVVLSKKVSNTLKWVNSLESRTIMYDDEDQFSLNLLDISSIISLKTNLNQSFNFGYILRFRDTETIHRTFQHYNVVNQFTSLKVGHRFAFEQFYQTKRNTTLRSRYRVSIEKPLNGEKTDVGEFYLKFGNEYLYDFQNTDLEVRFTPYLGFKASKTDRVEAGFDYRVGNFISNTTENNLWFRVTWYISLN